MYKLREIHRKKMSELGPKGQESKPVIDRPIEVTDGNFDEVVKEHPAIVIDFWAPWCMPCLALAPVVEKIAREYAGKVVFGKLNVDENRDTVTKFEVTAVPTLLFFRNGERVDRVLGVVTHKVLEQRVKKLLAGTTSKKLAKASR
jgi:thioredoxin 1